MEHRYGHTGYSICEPATWTSWAGSIGRSETGYCISTDSDHTATNGSQANSWHITGHGTTPEKQGRSLRPPPELTSRLIRQAESTPALALRALRHIRALRCSRAAGAIDRSKGTRKPWGVAPHPTRRPRGPAPPA